MMFAFDFGKAVNTAAEAMRTGLTRMTAVCESLKWYLGWAGRYGETDELLWNTVSGT
jgi:hypothetical protein